MLVRGMEVGARVVVAATAVLLLLTTFCMREVNAKQKRQSSAAPAVEIETIPPNQDEGADFSVTCTATGNPLPTVYWTMNNDGDLPYCARDVSGILLLTNFKEDCAGVFECHAINTHGTDTANITLSAVPPTTTPPTDSPCEFACGPGPRSPCVPMAAICNGTSECSNGADEASCVPTATDCRPDEVLCGSGECVHRSHVCDGVEDCNDGVDERECFTDTSSPCLSTQFQCNEDRNSPICIPKAQRCDGVFQCDSSNDERGCERPRPIHGPVRESDVTLGSSITLTCRAGGVPTPFVTWQRDCGPLPRNSRYSIVSKEGRGRLTIRNVTVADAGIYACVMVSFFGREQIGDVTTKIIVQDPAAFQCEDSDGVPYPAGTKYYLRRTVESAVGSINAADVIFVVDESGSMVTHMWLEYIIHKLDRALKALNIGNGTTTNNNMFALVGFARDSDAARGGVVIRNLTTPTKFISGLKELTLTGVYEDGYSGMLVALKKIKTREKTSKLMILVTDEDRDVLDFTLNRDRIRQELGRLGFKLNVVVHQPFTGIHLGKPFPGTVFGIDAKSQAYVLDEEDPEGYISIQRGVPILDMGAGSTFTDYVELALSLGGGAWDLTKLEEGEPVVTAFSNAFVRVNAEAVLSSFQACFECECEELEPKCARSPTSLQQCSGEVDPVSAPPYVCVSPVTAAVSTSMRLRCNTRVQDSSDRVVRFRWRYPEGVFPMFAASNRDLILSGATEKAIGQYTCEAWTFGGQVAMATAEVVPPVIQGMPVNQVLRTPKVMVTPKSISVAVGDQAELDCMVEGWPDPRVTWTRSLGGGLPLTATVTKEKGKDVWTLRVASVSVLYYGEYVCAAENMLGKDSASGTIEKI